MQYGSSAEFAKFFYFQFFSLLILFLFINCSYVIPILALSTGQPNYVRHINPSKLFNREKKPGKDTIPSPDQLQWSQLPDLNRRSPSLPFKIRCLLRNILKNYYLINKPSQTVVQNAKPTGRLYWKRNTLVNGFILSVSYGGKNKNMTEIACYDRSKLLL